MPGDTRDGTPSGGVVEVAKPSNKGNGMVYEPGGQLLVCEHATIARADGLRRDEVSGRETVASHFEGKELNSPNDVIVAEDGSILFSDPWYGRMPVLRRRAGEGLDFQGVYRIPPLGGDPRLLADDFEQPNGLCFSPDESLLYINDARAHIRTSTCAATARSRAGGCSSRASAAA